MKVLDNQQILFPQTSQAKFLLFSNCSKVGEISLPQSGVTFFPPVQKFADGKHSQIFRIRFDFLDGDGMEMLHRIIRFIGDDPWRHKLRLVIPGDNPHGYEVEPYGDWRSWFFDDVPQGYGPVEVQFVSSEMPVAAGESYSDAQPWLAE